MNDHEEYDDGLNFFRGIINMLLIEAIVVLLIYLILQIF